MKKRPKVEYFDKYLPNQREFTYLAPPLSPRGFSRQLFGLLLEASAIAPVNRQFRLSESTLLRKEEMGSNPLFLRFLALLVEILRPRRVLEIGTFIGLSAMSMAKYLPPGGRLLTIEKFEPTASVARKNFRSNRLDKKIRLLVGDAFGLRSEIRQFSRSFDLVFIDGNKERYADYLGMAIRLLAPGGIILVDDALFHGDVLRRKPATEKGRGVKRCLQRARRLPGFLKFLLPMGNGTLILRKKA